MKEKFKFSALLAGGLIMLAPILRCLGRTLYVSMNYGFTLNTEYFVHIILFVLFGLAIAASAFTKWAKIPGVLFLVANVPVLLKWAFELAQWFLECVSYGMNLSMWLNAFDFVISLIDVVAFVVLIALMIISLVKPDLKALKLLGFIPFLLVLIQSILFVLIMLCLFIELGADFFEWLFSNGVWVQHTGNIIYFIGLSIGLLLFGISLRPKKVKEIEEM